MIFRESCSIKTLYRLHWWQLSDWKCCSLCHKSSVQKNLILSTKIICFRYNKIEDIKFGNCKAILSQIENQPKNFCILFFILFSTLSNHSGNADFHRFWEETQLHWYCCTLIPLDLLCCEMVWIYNSQSWYRTWFLTKILNLDVKKIRFSELNFCGRIWSEFVAINATNMGKISQISLNRTLYPSCTPLL